MRCPCLTGGGHGLVCTELRRLREIQVFSPSCPASPLNPFLSIPASLLLILCICFQALLTNMFNTFLLSARNKHRASSLHFGVHHLQSFGVQAAAVLLFFSQGDSHVAYAVGSRVCLPVIFGDARLQTDEAPCMATPYRGLEVCVTHPPAPLPPCELGVRRGLRKCGRGAIMV